MPPAANRIGPHEFLALHGQPEAPREQVSTHARYGVDGVQVAKDARRGLPFVLRSQVDVENLAAGRDLLDDYRALIADAPVTLVQCGLSSIDQDYQVCVLDVKLVELREIGGASGGLADVSGAWLVCDWSLIAVVPEAAPNDN